MKRLSNTEAKLKESVAYKKKWQMCFLTEQQRKFVSQLKKIQNKKKNGVNVIIKLILSTKLKVH